MIRWHTQESDQWTLIEFSTSTMLDHRRLGEITLPSEVVKRTDLGLIISGRGPIWLHAHLTHLAHPFAWVATYEPRLRGAVVVESHLPGGPATGHVIPMASKSIRRGASGNPGMDAGSHGYDATFGFSTKSERTTWREPMKLAAFVLFTLAALTVGSSLADAGWPFLRALTWPSTRHASAILRTGSVPGEVVSVPAQAAELSHALPGSLSVLGFLVWMAALVVFFRLVFWLYRQRFHTHRRMGIVTIIPAAVALLLAGHTVMLGSHEWLSSRSPWSIGALLVLLPVCVWQAHRFRSVLTGVRSLSARSFSGTSSAVDQGIPPVRHLILPLSAPDWRPDWQPPAGRSGHEDQKSEAVFIPDATSSKICEVPVSSGPVRLCGRDIGVDINAMERLGRPKWQHMLRALQPHLSTLETVWLIGSNGSADSFQPDKLDEVAPKGRAIKVPDTLGSFAFLDDAARLIRPYLRAGARIVRCQPLAGETLGFEDVETLQRAMLRIVTIIQENCGAAPDEIVIDSTGGLKTTSIVGAVSTLNNESRFQYIDSRPPHNVYLFDQRFDMPPEVHGV